MDTGRVEAICTAPESGAEMERRDSVEAVAGKGLRGDRYFDDEGTWSGVAEYADTPRDVTLFAGEVLDAVARDYDIELSVTDHRRNVTVRGVAVNRLVGERFAVGDAVLEGVQLCEPCSYLESLLDTEGVREALVHRGGLNAAIVESGVVRVDDPVERP
jgi:MOSC domain-containing protein YiiM